MSSPVLWYATRATGLVSLILLTATTVLGILTANRATSPRWPAFSVQDLHRRLAVIAMGFLACHILTSVVDTYVHIGWAAIVVPFASSYKRLWVALGAVGVDLLIAVALTSFLERRPLHAPVGAEDGLFSRVGSRRSRSENEKAAIRAFDILLDVEAVL